MTSRHRPLARASALTLALGVAACSHGPKSAPPVGNVAQSTPTAEIDSIQLLLNQGQPGAAKKRINNALKRDPMNPALQLLRDSIDRDPQELLGPTSFPYTTRDGDTMSDLAQRFLGNRLKAYQLARYNDIARPDALAAGQTLRIPGQPPRPEPIRRSEPRPAPAAPSPIPAKPRASAPKPTAPAAPPANPVAARQARAAGLAALNSGDVARAVAQLRRAAALAPNDPVIARDLARAQRIAATVKARQ